MMVMKMRMMMVMVMWWARCEWAPGNKRKFGEQSGQKGASTVLKKKVKGTWRVYEDTNSWRHLCRNPRNLLQRCEDGGSNDCFFTEHFTAALQPHFRTQTSGSWGEMKIICMVSLEMVMWPWFYCWRPSASHSLISVGVRVFPQAWHMSNKTRKTLDGTMFTVRWWNVYCKVVKMSFALRTKNRGLGLLCSIHSEL